MLYLKDLCWNNGAIISHGDSPCAMVKERGAIHHHPHLKSSISAVPASKLVWSNLKKRMFSKNCIIAIPMTITIASHYLIFQLSGRRPGIDSSITLRIARPRNALWRAILRRAILSTSFIRIARPIYFVFIVLICPSNSHMCCLE